MTTSIPFTKMHGAANDYIYLDAFAQPEIAARCDLSDLSVAMSDRHRGIGSDGLIVVMPPDHGVDAQVRMRMFNADGSESEMCGNGIRCVAKLAYDRGHCRAKPMRVQTGAGVLSIDYEADEDDRIARATVDMGAPILEAAKIPINMPDLDRIINHRLRDLIDFRLRGSDEWTAECGLDRRMTGVSMGNPHVVLYCGDVMKVPLAEIGPLIERHPVFPRRVNVHFVTVQSESEVVMRTWERGSGMTMACGTGACAVCVAGVLTGRTERRILAHLPGGDLTLRWDERGDHVFMTGEAKEVFRGEWMTDR